ncbi:MAG: membrane protein insertase YidC [Solirubrobacteraceae bacterium]|nr:membrane protein insertase YidC [Solirubrobacteraceae bacterium]
MIDLFVNANVLQPLIDVFEELLKGLHSVIGSWGFAIIGLTLVIRSLLLPLSVVQYKSMKGMAALGPKIKELQAKYKEDPPKLMEEQRKLMRESGVNPAAGCLPILLQAPVFISLFYMLRADLKFDICGIPLNLPNLNETVCSAYPAQPGFADNAEKFLFIHDLTDKATGGILVLLLVLYVGSQLLSTLLMPSTVQGMQRNIFYALPFLFVPFILTFPAGLLVYWITTNLYTVVQQVALRRIYGAPGVTTSDDPVSIVQGAVEEVVELRKSHPSERPTKRKRTGKRR